MRPTFERGTTLAPKTTTPLFLIRLAFLSKLLFTIVILITLLLKSQLFRLLVLSLGKLLSFRLWNVLAVELRAKSARRVFTLPFLGTQTEDRKVIH